MREEWLFESVLKKIRFTKASCSFLAPVPVLACSSSPFSPIG